MKHARLAMLCAAGWPLGEMWHGPLRRLVGSDIDLAGPGGRAPAVLNGGLGGLAGDFCFAVMIALRSMDAMMGRCKLEGPTPARTFPATAASTRSQLRAASPDGSSRCAPKRSRTSAWR